MEDVLEEEMEKIRQQASPLFHAAFSWEKEVWLGSGGRASGEDPAAGGLVGCLLAGCWIEGQSREVAGGGDGEEKIRQQVSPLVLGEAVCLGSGEGVLQQEVDKGEDSVGSSCAFP